MTSYLYYYAVIRSKFHSDPMNSQQLAQTLGATCVCVLFCKSSQDPVGVSLRKKIYL